MKKKITMVLAGLGICALMITFNAQDAEAKGRGAGVFNTFCVQDSFFICRNCESSMFGFREEGDLVFCGGDHRFANKLMTKLFTDIYLSRIDIDIL